MFCNCRTQAGAALAARRIPAVEFEPTATLGALDKHVSQLLDSDVEPEQFVELKIDRTVITSVMPN